jgi:(4S)-4-hydroxy-5-phosphonooxypentane-2,3-dione isomerase
MKIGVIAKLVIQPGTNQAFEDAFLQYEKAVHENEAGNIFFRLHRSKKDNCAYTVLEQYSDQAALDVHQNAEYYKAIPDTFGEFMAGPADIEYLDGVS